MPAPVTSPYELAADLLKQIIDAEWAVEGLVAEHDILHPSLGEEATRISIHPENEIPTGNNMIVNELLITVQFLGQYELDIDPEMAVDPRPITRHAERFRRACRASSDPGRASMWYFNIESVDYPSDPSGNKTRFIATVRAYMQNSGIIETTG